MRNRVSRFAACGLTRLVLHGAESGGIELPGWLERHRAACLTCQVATVRKRKMLAELAALRTQVEPAPYDLSAVLDHPLEVEEDLPEKGRKPTPARTTAVASALSVAAIGVIVMARRLRSSTRRVRQMAEE
ncbi:MAG: hypothetical protein OXH10_09280 [bacterium]|nr:hypothetical protein [bacterium]MCY3580138.1 hypothetical protein [bacterium]MCY3651409.1 hypothetical protein [bacterium]MDE0643384.1 hypothetical protein [bacterium]MYH55435.1 hypothetical protein [Acidimicrobiia bacterium]